MYLFAFVFILSGVMGMLMQVFVAQTSLFMSQQNAVGQSMVAWHTAASSHVRAAGLVTNAPCALSAPVSTLPACMPSGYLLANSTSLPQGYNYGAYTWSSIVYSDTATNQKYVITFAPTPAVGDIITRPVIGLTSGELLQQLRRSRVALVSFGYVADQAGARWLMTSAGYSFPVLTHVAVPLRSVAIVSAL